MRKIKKHNFTICQNSKLQFEVHRSITLCFAQVLEIFFLMQILDFPCSVHLNVRTLGQTFWGQN